MGNIRAFVAKLNAKLKNPNFALNLEISREWAPIRAFVAKLNAN
jgi:hypothetical protein